MLFLNIAEKPSVAKLISHTLSPTPTKTASPNRYTPNYKFTFHNNTMLFTSLLGHLYTHDFIDIHKDWSKSDPRRLLTETQIQKLVNTDQHTIKTNILNNARNADTIIMWTDCDREGENIAMEVATMVREKYPNANIKRARFNAITHNNIVSALENLVDINVNESNAVDARIELDLRLGSAFTRVQTVNIRRDTVISYGPCQIPTLNFVVERMVRIENFVPEDFYTLKLKIKGKMTDVFDWERGNIFGKNCVIYMYEWLMKQKHGVVIDVVKNPKEKVRPLPLRTVELQKACASIFKISSHQVMKVAEGLYTKGYISYPRTETDVYPKNFDFKEIVSKLASSYSYCQRIEQFFTLPRRGSNDDMAHSPIYPLKSGAGLANDDKKIYDFVARRFLGCISKNAVGEETFVRLKIAGEDFTLKGLKILERNYLEIYTYDSWNEKKIIEYTINDKIDTKWLEISDGRTEAPELITEPELIALMDKNGIGTDATIAEHIQKIQDRAYVIKRGKYFIGTNLGRGLIFGYNDLGLQNFVQPYLRCELEKQLKAICEGRIDKSVVVKRETEIYVRFYDIIANGIERIKDKIKECDDNEDSSSSSDIRPGGGGTQTKKKTRNKRVLKENNVNERKIPGTKKYKKDEKQHNTIMEKNDIQTYIYNKNGPDKKRKISNTKTDDQSNTINAEVKTEENTYNKNNTNVHNIAATPNCHCKIIASKNVVTKESPNKGKYFHSCSKFPNGCDFFEWIKQSILCFCNYEPQIKTSRTENSEGKMFYKCKKAHKPCKFFKWVDE